MNERKIRKLLQAARNEQSPSPTAGFDADVLRLIRLEGREPEATGSLFDALGALFPRIAWVSVLIIIVCILSDRFSSPPDALGLTDQVALFSEQWPFVEGGF
jgi:hypothetical protein